MNTRTLFSILLLASLLGMSACGTAGGEDPPAVPTCCNIDSPSCACFDPGGAWDPVPGQIQDVALDTLGTSGACTSYGGKPYYQMRLGFNSSASAELCSCLLAALAPYVDPETFKRDAWCSEAISYWHREAAIPYPTGFRNGTWLYDWQLPDTGALKLYYETEEATGGRGRWIAWSDLDYEDYQPGVNAPLPGSYILLRRYDETATPPEWTGHSHSIMIDELTVYRTALGAVDRMEVTIIEGNNGDRVTNTRVISDLLEVTPWENQFLDGHRKILGFGVDLDEAGDPIYDESRLHTVTTSSGRPMPEPPPDPSDLIWKTWYGPLVDPLTAFITTMRERGGPLVQTSTQVLPFNAIPDGRGVRWIIPTEIDEIAPQGFEVLIDLHTVHPVPLERLLFHWSGTEIPQGYRVLYAGANQEYLDAVVPAIPEDVVTFQQDGTAASPVPVRIGTEGANVRYLRLLFPEGSLLGVHALEELRFAHDWGPLEDTTETP